MDDSVTFSPQFSPFFTGANIECVETVTRGAMQIFFVSHL